MTKAKRPSEKALRKDIVATALAMSRSGLSPARSGNVSCRFKDGMLITPSGQRYEETEPEDIVFVAADGSVPGGQLKPSSEWHFHLGAYRARPDATCPRAHAFDVRDGSGLCAEADTGVSLHGRRCRRQRHSVRTLRDVRNGGAGAPRRSQVCRNATPA